MTETGNPPRQVDGFGIALPLRLLSMAVGTNWDADRILIRTAFPEAVPRGYKGGRIALAKGNELALSFPSRWLTSPTGKISLAGQGAPTNAAPADLSIIAAIRSAARPLLVNKNVGRKGLAKSLGLEEKALETALRLHKTTAAREMKRLRTDVAKDALLNSSRTIAEIGLSLGYEDQSHFSRFVRSKSKVSPHSSAMVWRKKRKAEGSLADGACPIRLQSLVRRTE